jgi:hypothetical protein
VDWSAYRAICDRGDVLSRWLLLHSAELLESAGQSALAARLRAIPAQAAALPRPADHRGGAETDFFTVTLELAVVREIHDRIAGLAADPARRLSNGRGLGGMVEAWGECVAWLDGSHPRSPLRDGKDG